MENLFQFEQDKYYALRRIPIIMRLKLDLCGIKLTIGDWSKFPRADREQLVAMPYQTPEHIAAIRKRLKELIAACDGESMETEPVEMPAPWNVSDAVPYTVTEYLREHALPVPSLQQWSNLSDLQRFALLKLTRQGHENKKLPLALKEFGLA